MTFLACLLLPCYIIPYFYDYVKKICYFCYPLQWRIKWQNRDVDEKWAVRKDAPEAK